MPNESLQPIANAPADFVVGKDIIVRGLGEKASKYLIAFYAILGGLTFFLVQTSKLFRPESAEIEMITSPIGRYDWGYVWSDTVIAGPALLIGGIALLLRNIRVQRIGQLLVFTGFAINLYAMVCIWVGLWALGHPMKGSLLWINIILTALGVFCMTNLGIKLTRRNNGLQQGDGK